MRQKRADHATRPGDRPGHVGHEGHRGRRGRSRRLDRRGRGAARVSGRQAGSSRTRRRCSTRSSAQAEKPWRRRTFLSRPSPLANQGETVLAWDRDTGRPLSPAVVWQDRRAESICAPLSASADDVAQRTGLVLDPYFSAPKMAWIRANMTTAGVVTTTDTWLVHRLCGAFVTDASTASRSLLISTGLRRMGRRAARPVRADRRSAARHRRMRPDRGQHRRFRADDSRRRSDRRPAGRAAGRKLPVTRRCQVHIRHGRLPAGTARRQRGAVHVGPDHLGGVAAARATRRTASTDRSTRRRPRCAGPSIWGWCPRPIRSTSVAADSSDGVLCVPALAGLAAPWWDSRPRRRSAE